MPSDASTLSGFAVLGSLTATAIVTFITVKYYNRNALPVPPGPKGLPFIGNIRELNPIELWKTSAQWGKEYGDVVYTHLFGKGIIFLNSVDVINALMDKRANLYSDKPRLIMVNELCGAGNMVVFTNYGDRARRQRRLMSHTLSQFNVPRQHEQIELEGRGLIDRFIHHQEDPFHNLRRYAVSIVLRIVYGIEVREVDGSMKYLEVEEYTADLLSNEIMAGGGVWPVDMMPWLRHLPSWLPGTGFQRKATAWKKGFDELREAPFAAVKDMLSMGKATPSFCSESLTKSGKNITEQDETDIKDTANSMYSASMDTTVTIMSHFLLAMMQYPDVQKKAQAELDSVLGAGPDRMPTFADRERLPYVQAIVEEIFRWSCPVPLALPHCLLEDDEFNGMLMPKGSIIFANIWNIVRDENIYPDPEKFDPERFLGSNKQHDPRLFIFGFGRRRCPGLHLGEASIWYLVASMLATLHIEKPIGLNGKAIEPDVQYKNCIFRTPTEFKVDIVPRANSKAALATSPPMASTV